MLYQKRGSNPHERNAQGILSPSCLPFHHSGTIVFLRLMVKPECCRFYHLFWLRGQDSNMRPPGYEPGELPTAPPRDIIKRASCSVCECKGSTFRGHSKTFGAFFVKKCRIDGFPVPLCARFRPYWVNSSNAMLASVHSSSAAASCAFSSP